MVGHVWGRSPRASCGRESFNKTCAGCSVRSSGRRTHTSAAAGDAGAVWRDALRTSLRGAIARVLADQGKTSVNGPTYDKSIDYIRSVTAGTVGRRPIDWQNRPTVQQVVAFTRHPAR